VENLLLQAPICKYPLELQPIQEMDLLEMIEEHGNDGRCPEMP
jgi:hypothetical protein